MPYLADCRISTQPLEGGIEITDNQYLEAMAALAAGRPVRARGGEMLIYSGEQRTVYRKTSGRAVEIAQEDRTPEDCTDEPPGEFQVWGSDGWEDDLNQMAEAIRADRNSRLTEADHLVNMAVDTADAELEQAARAYRQDLREVPQQPGFPRSVEWPASPL